MKISFKWLCEFIPDLKKVDPFLLAKEFTLKSFEVEEIIDEAKAFENMVVGKIVKLQKHPNADKLLLVDTNIGEKTVQIVCGCTNLEIGQLVFVALPGAKVKWHGEGEFVELSESEIRGEKSFGMICTSVEVGFKDLIPQTHDREACVLDFLEKSVGTRHVASLPGVSISEILGINDIIFDVDNKTLTNRPDLWGHVGLAREAAAIFGKKFVYHPTPSLPFLRGGSKGGVVSFSVIIKDTKACPRYSGVLLENIEILSSPFWMRKRLWSVGIRPINNMVDITNYVMVEIGQPMHAFDARKLVGKQIVVEKTKKEELWHGLDEKEYHLPKDTIVITDGKNIQAVGGILGGASSEISSATTSCFFESANFDAGAIRRASMKIGVRTDASSRHEKNLDPTYTLEGIYRALTLIKECSTDAKIASQIIDVNHANKKKIFLSFSHEFLEKKIGVVFKEKNVKEILLRLGFKVSLVKNIYKVEVPSFRATKDIQIAEDVIEEIARMYGYDRIFSTLPVSTIFPPKKLSHLEFERKVKNIFARDLSFFEIYLYAFEDDQMSDLLGYKKEEAVEIENAIQKELRFLRMDLIPGLLRAIKKNENQFKEGKIFEVSRVFHNKEKTKEGLPAGKAGLPKEERRITVAIFSEEDNLFLRLKGDLEIFFKKIGIQKDIQFVGPEKSMEKLFSTKHSKIMFQNQTIGFLGEPHENVKNLLKLKKSVAVAEMNLDALLQFQKNKEEYQTLSRFPSVELDISAVVPNNILWYTLSRAVKNVENNLIEDVKFFDIFESETIGIGTKSIAFRITYRHSDRTLTLPEVMPLHEKIIELLEKKFRAKIRK